MEVLRGSFSSSSPYKKPMVSVTWWLSSLMDRCGACGRVRAAKLAPRGVSRFLVEVCVQVGTLVIVYVHGIFRGHCSFLGSLVDGLGRDGGLSAYLHRAASGWDSQTESSVAVECSMFSSPFGINNFWVPPSVPRLCVLSVAIWLGRPCSIYRGCRSVVFPIRPSSLSSLFWFVF